MSLRVVFMGTPDFAANILKRIHNSGNSVVGVFSQPPRAAGRRGLQLVDSPVACYAKTHNLPLFTPLTLKDSEIEQQFLALEADVIMVVAYGLLLPSFFLDTPRLGAYNIHASLLPRWRGAAPIHRAIMAGDKQTGVAVMKMELGLDTGPTSLIDYQDIADDMTTGELHDLLSDKGAELAVKALALLEQDKLELTDQAQEGITYAQKISKEETRVNWEKPAIEIVKHINGLSPMPGAWCEMSLSDKIYRVKLLKATLAPAGYKDGDLVDGSMVINCADGGAIAVSLLQRAGGKILSAGDFLVGNRLNSIN